MVHMCLDPSCETSWKIQAPPWRSRHLFRLFLCCDARLVHSLHPIPGRDQPGTSPGGKGLWRRQVVFSVPFADTEAWSPWWHLVCNLFPVFFWISVLLSKPDNHQKSNRHESWHLKPRSPRISIRHASAGTSKVSKTPNRPSQALVPYIPLHRILEKEKKSTLKVLTPQKVYLYTRSERFFMFFTQFEKMKQ